MGQTFLVALSGGVDSAVTAAMLLRQGHQVIGVTMDIGYGNAGLEAAAVADSLNIKHHIINVEQSFKDIVIADFLDSYLRGETPNPCVICNQRIKFKVFEPLMKELSADYLATGHYVQKGHANGRYFLYKAAYQPKDQSY
ncbi:MAG: 7-cyano-7-deazaguanine synthase, partial [Clostridiales bacterium]